METSSSGKEASNDDVTAAGGAERQRIVLSRDLLGGDKEILIDHHGEIYRLRETRNGKLILGK